MSDKSKNTRKNGKRNYRKRVKCNICQKEINSDYREKHVKTKHRVINYVTFSDVVEKSQRKIVFNVGTVGSSSSRTSQPDTTETVVEGEDVKTAIEREDVGTASHNLPSYSFIETSTQSSGDELIEIDKNLSDVYMSTSESSQEEGPLQLTRSSENISVDSIDDDVQLSTSENENEVSISDLKEISVNSNCSENDSALPITEDEPLRPILNKYMPKRFSTEKY